MDKYLACYVLTNHHTICLYASSLLHLRNGLLMRARKLFLTGSFTALVALFSAFSNAATSQASLAIRGEILPASCDLFIDNGGALKLGKPNSSATPTNQHSVSLPARTIGINIKRPALPSFGIRAVDISSNSGRVKHEGFDSITLFGRG